MDIPDDLSGMADPVPHYRDITPADTARDRMYTSLGRLADTMRHLLITGAAIGAFILGWKASG